MSSCPFFSLGASRRYMEEDTSEQSLVWGWRQSGSGIKFLEAVPSGARDRFLGSGPPLWVGPGEGLPSLSLGPTTTDPPFPPPPPLPTTLHAKLRTYVSTSPLSPRTHICYALRTPLGFLANAGWGYSRFSFFFDGRCFGRYIIDF